MLNKFTFFFFLAIGIAIFFAKRLGYNKEIRYDEDSFACSIPSIQDTNFIPLATEDIILYKEGIFIGGAGSTQCIAEESAERCPQGYMVFIDVRSGSPLVVKAKLEGTPKIFPFHPHGISFSHHSNRLYVINHGGTSSIGSRVEMFEAVSDVSDDFPTFRWIMSIGGGHRFPNGVLNSVVEGATTNEIYVTRWLSMGLPDGGIHHPKTVLEYLAIGVNFVIDLIAVAGNTGVYRCVFDIESKSTVSCKYASYGFVHANGLTTNKDRTKLFVNDVIPRKLYVMNIGKDGVLTQENIIELPHATDNVHYDEKSGELWMATIPLVHEYLARHHFPVSATFMTCQERNGECNNFKDELTYSGKFFSGGSACARSQGWIVCGSPYGEGVLTCRKKV